MSKCAGRTGSQQSSAAVDALAKIVGRSHVLTSKRRTSPYSSGSRFGAGEVLAVVLPGTLVEMWRTLQVCVEHNLIVIPQAANTGLTGGSGPDKQDYDRDIVIISTRRIDEIYVINDAKEAVCLAGSTLYELTDLLAVHEREPHSVIGSSSIGASVIGGIANNSGGSQVRKGPAFTKLAIFARVNEDGQPELVNHLGINLGSEPEGILDRLQRGDWSDADVDTSMTDDHAAQYSQEVRKIVDSPARYNANPQYLFEASGCAGKIMVFAVRTQTFPLEKNEATFYIGTNSPSELEDIRREMLTSLTKLPISGEYISRRSFDLAAEYGKDTFLGLKYAGSHAQVRLFSLKNWVNGVAGKLPLIGPTFADTVAQVGSSMLPTHLPHSMLEYRDRFAHHLILTVSGDQLVETEEFLASFFGDAERSGDFFLCNRDEAESAMLHRFGVASAAARYYAMNRANVSGQITFDVALRRDDYEWLECLPEDISSQLEETLYFGHFLDHCLHQNHVAKAGVDTKTLKARMTKLLEDRGARVPSEHGYGRIYRVPAEMEQHFRKLDPCNVFNAGVGQTSPHRNWE